MSDAKYHTGFRRFGAAIIDGIIFTPFLMVDLWILNQTDNVWIIFAWTAFNASLYYLYSIYFHYKFGRTIGKWVVRIKVLDISETKLLSLKQAFLRDSLYLIIQIIGLLYFLFLVAKTGDLDIIIMDYRNFIDYSFLCWMLLELLSMLTNDKRRAIHDWLAGSVVIIAKSS
ncbi:RDD family protein [Lacibacter sediminis]|uniref:RDD family protein n=1 Tax=Lacibacter sediminis TaxID=2760713 RepID=A0A7G5XMC5_9BACT|nr:RDD family protein [Lacibacter sediminis]QNA46628.1 RDD family protein [Lacibacter sediminis]